MSQNKPTLADNIYGSFLSMVNTMIDEYVVRTIPDYTAGTPVKVTEQHIAHGHVLNKLFYVNGELAFIVEYTDRGIIFRTKSEAQYERYCAALTGPAGDRRDSNDFSSGLGKDKAGNRPGETGSWAA